MSTPANIYQTGACFGKISQDIFIFINNVFFLLCTQGNINQSGWCILFKNNFYMFLQCYKSELYKKKEH